MSNLNRHPVRRAAVGVLAGTLAFTSAAIAAGVTPANAVEGFSFDRLSGADRFATAAAIAQDSFPSGADTAIIARGDVFADALTANYLAGTIDAPILLTASNDLPQATADALDALGVQNVIIVGGTTAVSASVEAELDNDYGVTRLGGADRYQTAELIAQAAADEAPVGVYDGLRTAFLASGQDFPDALAIGPLSYEGNGPLLITRPGDLPASTRSLLNELGIQRVVIAGGTTAVSTAVENEVEDIIGRDAIRLGGQTRFETATIIAETAYADSKFDFDRSHVNLARGDSFADALAGGPHAGRERAPIVLTFPNTLPAATEAFLEDNSDTLTDGHIFGGFQAVSLDVENAAEAAAQGDAVAAPAVTVTPTGGDTTITAGQPFTGTISAGGATIENVNVSGACITDNTDVTESGTAGGDFDFSLPINNDAAAGDCVITFVVTADGQDVTETVTVTVEAAPAATFDTLAVTPETALTQSLADDTDSDAAVSGADNRSFAVTGLTDTVRYRVTLVNADSIQGDTFKSSVITPATATTAATFGVDIGADIADIVSVNGNTSPTGLALGNRTATAFPVNGNLTFVIDGEDVGTVVPFVYIDGGQGGTSTTGGTSNRLETSATADGQFAPAIETFGTGGPTTYVNPPAASQVVASPRTIDAVNKDANQFDAGGFSFTYDANDTFSVNGVPTTLGEFEAQLSSGDTFTASFSANPAASSSFALNDVNPATPAAPTVTVANNNDVTVSGTVTLPVDSVQIQRATVPATGTPFFATVATVTPNQTTGAYTFSDNDVAAGSYQYRVIAVNDGDSSTPSNATAATTTAPGPDQNAPDAIDTVSTQNAGLDSDLGAGDVFKVVFDEAIAAPSSTTTFRLDDADTTIADLVNGQNATFAVNIAAETVNGVSRPAGTVLTVTVTGAPVIVVAGTVAGVQLPAVIVAAGGITDVAGNQFAPTAANQDVTIEQVGVDTQANSADAAAPTATTAGTAGNTTFTVTFNEAIRAGSVATTDFTCGNNAALPAAPAVEGGACTVTAVTLNAARTIATVTVSRALEEGDVVSVVADSVLDDAGNAGPAAGGAGNSATIA